MIEDVILKTRGNRRFDQTVPVNPETLRWFVKLARSSASGASP